MNLDELRSVQSKERSKDSLQHLRESFYADVGEYICDLREERERAAERASDPFDSEEVNRLTDEIKTAEEVVEAIYERRVGKVVKRASLAAADMPADEEGLTAEEQELFADLVDRIESNKSTVLDVLAGETDASDASSGDAAAESATDTSSVDDAPASDAADGSARPNAEAAAIASDSDASPAEAGDEGSEADGADDANGTDEADDADDVDDDPLAGLSDRTTVRITSDVGEILGVDQRSYDLAEEDVVTLPAANAEPLLERDAAERLE
ncbi:DNA replication complex subunit Gins51 [Halomicrococcus gelatinilyticus]|uniref:DNA replication complex subunit Gins51 n=1 Tax=Halomicrococcus gelatinilyticus TaxID=1702103 RepID=UPI002E14E99E